MSVAVSSPPQPAIPRRYWPHLLILVAALLRLSTLSLKSVWLDEAYSVFAAAQGHALIWTGFDAHPPLYYSFLHEWLKLVPNGSEFGLRLPSALASIGGLVLIYHLGRRLFDERFGRIALALLAFSPLEIWYAGEARMYAFVILAWLMVALALVWEHWQAIPLYLLGLVLGLYVEYTFIPVWLVLCGVWLVYWWQRGRKPIPLVLWLSLTGLGWLVYRPWWPHLQPFLDRLVEVYDIYLRARFSFLPLLSASHLLTVLGLGMVTWIAAAFLIYKLLHYPAITAIIAPLVLFPFLFGLLLTPIPRLYIPKRILVTGWPLVILFVTWLLWQLRDDGRRMIWLTVAVSVLAALVNLFFIPKPDWRGAAAFLSTYATAGDVVWVVPDYNGFPYDFYAEAHPNQSRGEQGVEEASAAADTLWLISERPASPIPPHTDQIWLDENWVLVQDIPDFFRLTIRRYRVR